VPADYAAHVRGKARLQVVAATLQAKKHKRAGGFVDIVDVAVASKKQPIEHGK
jgi:hypothetical protein